MERPVARRVDAGASLSRLAHWNDGPSDPPQQPFLIQRPPIVFVVGPVRLRIYPEPILITGGYREAVVAVNQHQKRK